MPLRFPRPVPAVSAHTWLARQPVHRVIRPLSPPVTAYTQTRATDLGNNVAQLVIPASGTVTLQVGPQGVGTTWTLTMAAISTTVGAADTSTCIVYAGTLGVPSVQGAQSYAGGGDTAGFNSVSLYPGQYVIAVWSGGTPGSVATLVAYGSQDALVIPS